MDIPEDQHLYTVSVEKPRKEAFPLSDLACFPEALIAGMKFTTRAQGDI